MAKLRASTRRFRPCAVRCAKEPAAPGRGGQQQNHQARKIPRAELDASRWRESGRSQFRLVLHQGIGRPQVAEGGDEAEQNHGDRIDADFPASAGRRRPSTTRCGAPVLSSGRQESARALRGQGRMAMKRGQPVAGVVSE